LIDDSKKSIPSSAGVLGVFAIVGDEPVDEEGDVCLFLGIFKVGWGRGVTNFDLIFTAAISGRKWRRWVERGGWGEGGKEGRDEAKDVRSYRKAG